MREITDDEFKEIILKAIEEIPKQYRDRLDNVAFILEDEPSREQRHQLNLRGFQTLLGLYEGAPLPTRMGQTKILPDKITLFKHPLLHASHDEEDLKHQIKHTIWHEVAHYFGLDHQRIDELDNR